MGALGVTGEGRRGAHHETEAGTALHADEQPEPDRCAGGRLRIGDLAIVGDEWVSGVQTAIETARAWRPDARLVSVQVGCTPLPLGPALRAQLPPWKPAHPPPALRAGDLRQPAGQPHAGAGRSVQLPAVLGAAT